MWIERKEIVRGSIEISVRNSKVENWEVRNDKISKVITNLIVS